MDNNVEYIRSLSDEQLEERRVNLEVFLNGMSHAYWEDRADNLVGPNPREAELALIETELDKRFERKHTMDKRIVAKVENACAAYWYKDQPNIKGVSLSECLAMIEAMYGSEYVPHARHYVIGDICGKDITLV